MPGKEYIVYKDGESQSYSAADFNSPEMQEWLGSTKGVEAYEFSQYNPKEETLDGDSFQVYNPKGEAQTYTREEFADPELQKWLGAQQGYRTVRVRPAGAWGDGIRRDLKHQALVDNLAGTPAQQGEEWNKVNELKRQRDELQLQLDEHNRKSKSELDSIATARDRQMKEAPLMRTRKELEAKIRDLDSKIYNSSPVRTMYRKGHDAASLGNSELEQEFAPYKEQIDKEVQEERESRGLLPYMGQGGYVARQPSYEENLYTAAKNLNDETMRLYDAPGRYENGGKMKNFFKGAGERASQADFWSLGLTGMMDSMALRQVFDKIRGKIGNMKDLTEENIDEALDPMEKQLLAAFFRNAEAQATRADDLSLEYQAGQSAADSAMFMAEFALSGGISGAIGKAALEAAPKSVQAMAKWIGKKLAKETPAGLAKGALKVGTDLGKAAVNMWLQPGTYKGILEAQNQLDENGEFVDRSKAAWKAILDRGIEVFSESTGDYIPGLLGWGASKVGADKLVGRLANTEVGKWGRAFYNSDALKTLKAGGWNGYFGEMTEEFIGAALRSVTGVDPDAWKEQWDKDNIAVMAMSFLPMSVIGGAVNTVKYGVARKNYSETREDLVSRMQDLGFTPEQIAHATDLSRQSTPEQVRETLKPVVDAMASRGARKADQDALMDYAMAAVTLNAYDGYESERVAQERQTALAGLTGTYGEFWQGNEKDGRTVERVALPDGRTGYVINTDETGLMSVRFDDGSTGFTDAEHGAQTETSTLDQYLDSTILLDRQSREAARMQEDAAVARQQFDAMVAQNAAVPMGTAEAPEEGRLLTQQDPATGALVPVRDAQGNYTVVTMNGQAPMSEDDLAAKWGIRLQPETREQLEADAVNEYDAKVKRKKAYNTIPQGTVVEARLDGIDEPVPYRFTHAAIDEETGELTIFAEDIETGEEVSLPESAFPDLEQAAAQMDTAEEVTGEQPADATPRDFKGRPLPLNEDGTVNQAELWDKDPEAWAAWNDQKNGGDATDTLQYVGAAVSKLQSDITALNSALASELDFNKRDAIKEEIARKTERLNQLNDIVAGYQKRAEAREQAEKQAKETGAKRDEAIPAEVSQGALGPEYVVNGQLTPEQQAAAAEEQRRIPLRARAQEWADKTGVPVELMETPEDVQDQKAREAIAAGQRVTGWYDPNTGKVYIYVPNIRNEAEIDKTYIHEVISHKGLKEMLGVGFNTLLDHVWSDLMNEEQRQFYTNYVKMTQPNAEGKALERAAADEYIAALSEKIGLESVSEEELSNWEKFVKMIRDFFMQMLTGGVKITEEDLSDLLVASMARYKEIKEKGDAMPLMRASGENGAKDLSTEALTNEIQKEMAEKGLVMDGGVVMDEQQAKLKEDTGYKTPNELDEESNPITGDVRFSITTVEPWERNYMSYPGAEQRVVDSIEHLVERMTANELVYGVVPTGIYKYGEKTSGSKAGPLRTNIEYIVTFDMDTSCPRSLQYLAFARKIESQIGRPLTQTESIQLIEMMRVYGQMIPCVYCYCENKRQALKQYYTDFLASRHGVISAKTEAEALAAMYGHKATKDARESNDPAVVLTDAAYKVYQRWRNEKRYNPTIRQLWSQYRNDRNVALTILDDMYASGVISTGMDDEAIAKKLYADLRVTDPLAQKALEEIVSDWKWNRIEDRPHDDFTRVANEDDLVVSEDTLALWREMTLYGKSASQAKNTLRYVPYTDELKTLSKKERDYINGMGGLRMHSSNDFRLDYVLDYFQFMADMAVNKMFGHTYTKSPEFVRIFGNSGYKINMSIAAYEDSRGIRPNAAEGFEWSTAQELRRLFPNAGTMLMATSDRQVQFALDNDWVDMCIPFHASGLPKAVWYDMRMWTDYSSTQNERFLNGDEMRAALEADGVEVPKKAKAEEVERMYIKHFGIKVVRYKTGKKKGKRFAPHFLPGPTIVDGINIPGHNNDYDTYIFLCRDYGVHPRFYGMRVKDNTPAGGGREIDVTEHPRYMILIKETARTDTPQTPIQFDFDQPSEALGGKSPIEYAFEELEARAMAESQMAGGPVRNIYESYNQDPYGIVDQFINGIIKHKEETGKDYPLDYLTPDSRKWFMTERRALEDAYKDFDTIPYHPHEYDENGNLIMEPEDQEQPEAQETAVEDAGQRALDAILESIDRNAEKPGEDNGIRFAIRGFNGVLEAGDYEAEDNLTVAEEMEKAGKDPVTIWRATGWEKGADGRWRNEIPDAKQKEGTSLEEYNTAQDVIDAPELFKSYPDLQFTTIQLVDSAAAGAYNGKDNRITIDRRYNTKQENGRTVLNKEGALTLVHEFQHAIQKIEGFAKGGSTKMMEHAHYLDVAKDDLPLATFAFNLSRRNSQARLIRAGREEVIRQAENLDKSRFNDKDKNAFAELIDRLKNSTDKEYASMVRKAAKVVKDAKSSGESGYKRLAGEVESRNVEERSRLSEEARRNNPPSTTEDVSRRQQIIRFRVANEDQKIFISNAEKAVSDLKMDKATPEQWKKTLEKNGGLKAAEDKWLGLSTWLDGLDRKTVTKQEVLDFIAENQIQIEEQHYSEDVDVVKAAQEDASDSIVGGKSIEELQAEIDELKDSPQRYDFIGQNPTDQEMDNFLMEAMKEEYGDDFELAYSIMDGIVESSVGGFDFDEDDYASQMGGVRPINSTRLGYTTEGLRNRQEIALTVPTIEPWNEEDKIHFGDAGEGRAIAWARFGDTWTSKAKDEAEKKYREADKAFRDYRNEIVAKYAVQATGTKTTKDLATPEENAKVKELQLEASRLYHEWKYGQHPREKVLVIDEIQSKRHQEAREQGGYKDDSALKKAQARLDAAKKAVEDYANERYKQYGEENTLGWTREEKEEYNRLYRGYRDAQNIVTRNGFDPMEDEEYRRLKAEQEEYENSAEFRNAMDEWKERTKGGDIVERNEANRAIKPFQDRNYELIQKMEAREKELADEFNAAHKSKIPAAPFEKNWHELTMKRMLRYAAENGYDTVAWTTGEQQADRYDLGNTLDSISVRDEKWGREVELLMRDSGTVVLKVDENGTVTESNQDDFEGKNLGDIVGKDLAVKIMSAEDGEEISGDGLRVGGEGMKGFYDDILPRFMNKYGKKWGVKVEDIFLPLLGEDAAGGAQKGLTMHSVPVTEEMKDSVMQGQTMFRVAMEEYDKESQELFDAAKERFGTTRDLREAGYILPDGSLLDFSGRHQTSGDTSFLNGRRSIDHRDIADLNYERDLNTPSGRNTSMPDFIERGAIRIHMPGMINLATKPTPEQASVLERLINADNHYVTVDFGNGYSTEHSAEYDNARPVRIINDINRYFDEGYTPRGNTMFRITPEQDAEYMEAVNAGDMDKAQQMVKDAFKAAYPDTQVVDENGDPRVLYHGGTFGQEAIDDYDPYVWEPEFGNGWFATSKQLSKRFVHDFGQEPIQVFLNIRNPFAMGDTMQLLIDNKKATALAEDYAERLGVGVEDILGLIDTDYSLEDAKGVTYRSEAFAINRNPKFAELIKSRGYDGAMDIEADGTVAYMTTDPGQIKSADPVTYDDQGNVIPLSERFNEGNDDIRFRFVGDKANLEQDVRENKAIAEKMEADGKDAKSIKIATGWERGADKMWRHEEDDLVLKPSVLALPTNSFERSAWRYDYLKAPAYKLSDIVTRESFKKLHDSYPDVDPKVYIRVDNKAYYNSNQKLEESPEHIRGAYVPSDDIIYIDLPLHYLDIDKTNPLPDFFRNDRSYRVTNKWEKNGDGVSGYSVKTDDDLRGVVLHEIQHIIQTKEGFSIGGSKREVGWWENEEADTNAYRDYKRLAGETEARNVAARMNMTEEERGKTLASETEDFAREEQIVRFRAVQDPLKIAELEAGEKIPGYRTVVLNPDGSMASPMAGELGVAKAKKSEDRRVKTSSFTENTWNEAEENPDLADENGKIKLIKTDNAKRGLVDVDEVDYNPYNHLRLSPVNLQFKDAWKRPDLIYIKSEVPKSEAVDLRGIKDPAEKDRLSPYHAEKAVLPVGIHDWSGGGELLLSRWDKPVGQVAWEEIADAWANDEKVKEGVQFDRVPPQILDMLAERGIEILPPSKGKDKNEAYKAWKAGDQEAYEAWRDTGKAPKKGKNGGGNTRFRIAYHGSVSDFDAFDINYAGSGEGFQAHGFGHYVSFNPDTATGYAWNNAFDKADREGKIDPEINDIIRNDSFDGYDDMVNRYNSVLASRQEQARKELEDARREDPDDARLIEDLQREYDKRMSYQPLDEIFEGMRNIYTVEIPDDTGENYIDEMKTLAKPLRRRIADAIRNIPDEKLDRTLHGPNWLPQGFKTLANVIEREQYAGLEIRRRMEDALGNTNEARKEVSRILHDAGFVGYTYDGRSDGPCAVIFSNDDIKVVEHTRFRVAGTADDLVKRVQDYGLRGILDEDAAKAFWADAYAVMPEDARKEIVDNAFSADADKQDLNIRREVRKYIAALAKKGYAEDESGLLRYLADRLKEELGEDLDENTLRYLIWRSANRYASNNILDMAEDIAMRRRLGVGEFNGQKFPTGVSEATQEAEKRIDEAENEREEERNEIRRSAPRTPFAALNRAMTAQRKYDQETVNSIVALAKDMIKKGNIDKVSAREMARLMTIIKDANGRKPATVKNATLQLLDFMVDHTVGKEKELLDKMLKVRTAKVREPGVDTIAKLDLRAQNIINNFRDNYKSSEEEIDKAIKALEDNLDDRRFSETSLEDMRSKLEGLQLAKQYAEEIAAKEADIKTVRDMMEYSKAKFDGLTTEEKRQLRTARNEEVAADYEVIRNKKIEQVDAYRRLRGDIAKAIAEGADRAQTFLEAERERVEQIHHWANSDMKGVPDDVDDRELKGWSKFINSSFAKLFTGPLANLDQMLRTLGRRTPEGRGYLWNWMMGAVRQASNTEKLGIDAAEKKLNDKVKEIFDEPDMEWNDLYSMERKMPKATMRYFSANGKWVEKEMTQGNLLYIYMVNKMTDGRMKLRQMDITDENVEDIKKALDPRFVELADWIQEEFLPGLRDRYNETHNRLFGTSMASIENYFPLRILGGVVDEKRNVGDQEQRNLPTDITGAIIKRVVNTKQLNLPGTDAFSTVIEHVREMEHWNAYAEASRDFSTLLKYKRFQNQLKQLDTVYGVGQDLLNLFWDTVNLSVGAFRPTTTPTDKAFLNLAKGVTAAKISFRAYTAIKQILSWPAFIADTNPLILGKNTLPINWKKNWDWAMENLPNFKKRVESRKAGLDILEDTSLDSKFWGTDFAKWINQNGMFMNAFVDALTVSIGARSVYETRKARYLKEGFSEEEADKKAKMDAEVAYNETQQSSEKEFMSTMQAHRTVANVALSAYRNSSMGYQRQLHQAFRTLNRMTRKGYKSEAIEYMTKQLEREGLPAEDAKKAATSRYERAGWQALARVAVFQWLVQFAWNLGSHAVYLLFGDDPDEKKAMLAEDATHALIGGPIEGLAAGNILSEAFNMIKNGENLRNWDPTTLPIMSDIKSTISKMSSDPVAGANDLVYLAAQIGLGTNPQTISDAIVAIVDACNGDFETAREVMFCIMRILAVPQSQLDQLMIDEIGMSAKDARELSYEDVAKRYVDYKMTRNAPVTEPLYPDELRKKREKSLKTTFKTKYNERQDLKEPKEE